MTVSESERHQLYQQLERIIGKKPTETMMSLLPPVGWADVATRRDLQNLEAKMESMESRLNERIIRTALVVNIPSILSAVAISFAAARLGAS